MSVCAADWASNRRDRCVLSLGSRTASSSLVTSHRPKLCLQYQPALKLFQLNSYLWLNFLQLSSCIKVLRYTNEQLHQGVNMFCISSFQLAVLSYQLTNACTGAPITLFFSNMVYRKLTLCHQTSITSSYSSIVYRKSILCYQTSVTSSCSSMVYRKFTLCYQTSNYYTLLFFHGLQEIYSLLSNI